MPEEDKHDEDEDAGLLFSGVSDSESEIEKKRRDKKLYKDENKGIGMGELING